MSYIVRKEIENHFCEGVLGKPILTERQLLEVNGLISDWNTRYEFWKEGIKVGPYVINSKYQGKNLEETLKYIGFHTGLPYLRLFINNINEFEEDIDSLLVGLFTDEGAEVIPVWRNKYLVHVICNDYNNSLLVDAIHKIAGKNPENLVILSFNHGDKYCFYERIDLSPKEEEREELKKVILNILGTAGSAFLEPLYGDLELLIEKLDQIKIKLIKDELLRSSKA